MPSSEPKEKVMDQETIVEFGWATYRDQLRGMVNAAREREDPSLAIAVSVDALAALLDELDVADAGVRTDDALAGALLAIPSGLPKAVSVAQYPAEYERADAWTAIYPEDHRRFWANGRTPTGALRALTTKFRAHDAAASKES